MNAFAAAFRKARWAGDTNAAALARARGYFCLPPYVRTPPPDLLSGTRVEKSLPSFPPADFLWTCFPPHEARGKEGSVLTASLLPD